MGSAMTASEPRELVARAQAVVLDFDGTLVDSNPIKFRAFERCFADLAERRDEVLAYCVSHHHVPREEKFRHIYERLLGRPYTLDEAARLHALFDAATTQAIIRAPAIAGAEAFLDRVSRTRVTALLSSTPHPVLLRILEGRAWRQRFDLVQGAPVEKAAWLQAFRAQRRLAGNDVVVFGDTAEDAAAAAAAGCGFVGVGPAPQTADSAWIADFLMLGPEGCS